MDVRDSFASFLFIQLLCYGLENCFDIDFQMDRSFL